MFARNFQPGARPLMHLLLAFALLFVPAVGGMFLPHAAHAQDAMDFRAALEGYGQWVQHPRWGEVWIPDQRTPDWQPYRLGRWLYTDEWGWYWDSEEDFGWITYHYGRWVFDRGLGWIWIPGADWGPAWVDWRQGDDFVGWAPLPPDEALDDDYETPDTYMFVRAGDLLAPQVYLIVLPPQERFVYYNRSFLVNRSVLARGGRFAVNPGVPPAFVARASGRPFHPVSVSPVVLGGTAGIAGAVVVRDNFRDRDRTRIVIRETNRFVQPNDRFVPLKPLSKGERGQLGPNAPSAVRSLGIETKSKSFGGATGVKTFEQQKTLQPGSQNNPIRSQDIQQDKALREKKFEQKTIQPGSQNNPIRSQDIQQDKMLREKKFEQKTFKQNDQIRSQNLQQQNTQPKTLPQQNLQPKTLQQGGSNPPHVQQPTIQPKVVTPPPPKSTTPPPDKSKQPQQ
jgi:hypothetical protein